MTKQEIRQCLEEIFEEDQQYIALRRGEKLVGGNLGEANQNARLEMIEFFCQPSEEKYALAIIRANAPRTTTHAYPVTSKGL